MQKVRIAFWTPDHFSLERKFILGGEGSLNSKKDVAHR
jgi:hypothetical protein